MRDVRIGCSGWNYDDWRGRLYPEGWGRASALLVFFGFFLTFVPQFVVGYLED